MTAPFAQAFAELREVIAHHGVINRREALARWKRRWIDTCSGLAQVTPLEELQQVDAKARAALMACRAEDVAVQLARSLVAGEGIAAQEMGRPAGGGYEFKLGVCVVRAEPKK